MDLAGFNAKPRRKSVFIRNIEKSRGKALNHKTLRDSLFGRGRRT